MRESRKKFVYRLVVFAAIIIAWQYMSGPILPPAFYGSPLGIANALWQFQAEGLPPTNPVPLWSHIWITVYETIVGFALGVGLGMLTGIILGLNKVLSDVLDPIIYGLYAIPKIALAPLFILWFGIYTPSKIFVAFALVYFIIHLATANGMTHVPNELINVIKVMGASRIQLIRKVILPSAYPYIFLGVRTSLPLAFVGAVVGEFLASTSGIGFIIEYEGEFLNTNGVFAGILVLTVITLAADYLLRYVQRVTLPWSSTAQ